MIASILAFIVAHSAVLIPFLVAVIDFLIGINPAWASSSLLELILSFLRPKTPKV